MIEIEQIFVGTGLLAPLIFTLLLMLADAIYPGECEAVVYIKPVRRPPHAASAYGR